jgi:hypothetical protein
MHRLSLPVLLVLALSCPCVAGRIPAPPQAARKAKLATIQRINMLGSGNDVAVEIISSQRVIAETQTLSDPDRIVVDLLGATPGDVASPIQVNRGGVKRVRVALRSSSPPVTRVVVELAGPQKFQVFPASDSVIVRLGNPDTQSAAAAQPTAPPRPPLRVTFENGLLSIRAEKATLSQVLYEIHRLTGADIPIPAGAEREPIVTSLGPGPAREVLASLLNGSHYNFVILGDEGNTGSLQQVILTPRFGSQMPEDSAPEPTPQQNVAQPMPAQAVRNAGADEENDPPPETVNGPPEQNAPPDQQQDPPPN